MCGTTRGSYGRGALLLFPDPRPPGLVTGNDTMSGRGGRGRGRESGGAGWIRDEGVGCVRNDAQFLQTKKTLTWIASLL